MKKYLYLLIITTSFACCNRPLNKPIVEPLTVDELRSVTKKDTTFIDFYENIQGFRQSFFSEDINQVKYGDISYNQLKKYIAYVNDTTFTKPIIAKAETEWNEKYNKYSQKLDSLSNYWKKYLEENSLESYVNIEFDHIDKDYYTYSDDIKDVNLAFKLTPLKGTIQQISFFYKIKSKLEADENESIYSSVFDDKRGSCITTAPFSKTVVRYWGVNYTLEKTLEYKSSAEFIRDYDITFEITKIRVNNKNITEDDLLVPEVIKNYFRYPSIYEDDVIKYFFNSEYIPKWEYIENAIDNVLKKKDEKCHNFLNAVSEFKENEDEGD